VPATRILVVDDESTVRQSLELALSLQGYAVETAADGSEALEQARAVRPDAIILDILMPEPDGIAVCRQLREAGDRTPILMVTARSAVGDRVAGLDAGADDYLVKPFALDELLARTRALLRRTGDAGGSEVAGFADLELDSHALQGRRGARAFNLTRLEYLLLRVFLEHPNRVLTRSAIFSKVWGYDFGSSSNALEVYIGYLRRKTEAGGEPRIIHTIRGVGYVLREP
jgi:two-component system response regulator MprA